MGEKKRSLPIAEKGNPKRFDGRLFSRTLNLFEDRVWIYILTLVVHSGYFSAQSIILGYLTKNAVNAITGHSRELLASTFILAAVLSFGSFVINPIAFYVKFIVTRTMLMDTRKKAIFHMEKLKAPYFDKKHSGDILSRLSSDITQVDNFFAVFREFLILLFTGLGSIAFMFILNVPIACMMVLIGILSSAANFAFSKPIRRASDGVQASASVATQGFVDIVAGNREIKNLNIGSRILGIFKEANAENRDLTMRRDTLGAFRESASYLVSALNLVGVIGIGSVMVVNKLADLGTVVAIVTLQNGATNLYLRLGGFLTQIQSALSGARRIFELLDTECEEIEDETERAPRRGESKRETSLVPGSRDIVVRNLVFSYPDGPRALDGLSLEIKEGHTAALVGSSGGGKSSILKLLLGLYQYQEGEILIGGMDVKKLSLRLIREAFSYVPQDSYIFDGTIEENIGLGRPVAGREEIQEASRMANAHDFILGMRDGYLTPVGERGVKLSGGQRQRIAIARAILKNAPVLLLDEATSSLDSESESAVQEALGRLMKDRTSIIVAHRLSTVENADVIFVLDGGKLIERGSHGELLGKRGRYFRLYQAQFAENG